MTISEKILDLRKSNGMSQEELAEKLNVSRQSVSKWESAASVPDVSKIIEISRVFGVSTDYLLKEDTEALQCPAADSRSVKTLSIESCREFLLATKRCSRNIAIGVFMCICSPIALIILAGLYEIKGVVSQGLAVGVGTTILLMLVAGAVTLFILNGSRLERYKLIKEGDFELSYGVEGILKAERDAFEPRFTTSLAISVALFILSVCPLMIVSSVVGEEESMVFLLLTALLLFMVAVGVFVIILFTMTHDAYKQLLRYEEYSPENAEARRLSDKLGGIYWTLAAAIYLAWSFLSGKWEITWVLWPVAGVLFAAILAALNYRKK